MLALTLGMMRIAGTLRFSPRATDLLVRMADRFGARGDEAVLNFYMLGSGLLSLLLAAGLVALANRWRGRRSRLDSGKRRD